MNTYRYDEEQIRQWVRQKQNREKSVKQICQEAVISRATLYNWINEFSDGKSSSVDKQTDGKETLTVARKPAAKPNAFGSLSAYRMLSTALAQVDTDGSIARKMVGVLVKRFTITVAKACEIVGIEESAYGYKPRKPEAPDQLVSNAIVALLEEDPFRGFNDCYELLRKAHPSWTRKQIKRVYREDRLYLKRTRARKGSDEAVKPGADGMAIAPLRLTRLGATWFLGMIEGEAEFGHWQLLFIIDDEDGMPLNARIYTGKFADEDLSGFLSMAATENGMPRKVKLAGKPPLSTRELTSWIWQHKLVLQTLSMGKPENLEDIERIEENVRQQFAGRGSLDELQLGVEEWLGS